MIAAPPTQSPPAAEVAPAAPARGWESRAVRALPWVFIGLGLLARLTQYASDRSLFLDEAFVATNIAQKSFAELLRPLLFDQRAPAGWLLAVKLATTLLGGGDLALRLVPLLAGLAAVPLFYLAARHYVGRGAAVLALAFFALSPPHVFYSSDLKQYSTDVVVCLAILLALATDPERRPTVARTAAWGLLGAIGLWFSLGALFVLAGVGGCRLLVLARRRRWADILAFLPTLVLWAAGLGALWWFQLRHFAAEPGWKGLWNDAFMPLPPRSFADLRWFVGKFFDLVSGPVGLSFAGLAALAFGLGLWSMWRTRRRLLGMLLAPVGLVLLASGLRLYPFSGRVVLFFGPPVLFVIAHGLVGLWRAGNRPARGAVVGAVLLLAFHPAGLLLQHLTTGKMYKNPMFPDYRFEETKPVMRGVRDRWRPGDAVYLYDMSHVAFEHYAGRYGFGKDDFVVGIQGGLAGPRWDEVRADLARMRGRPRVWFFFTHVWKLNGVDERKLCLYFLDGMGRRLDGIETPGDCDAAAYLYDMSSPPEGGGPERLPDS